MPVSFADFLRSYEARVAPLMKEANEAYWAATTTGSPEAEELSARKRAELRKLHSDPAAYAMLKKWREEGVVTDPLEARQLDLLINAYAENQLPAAVIEDLSRREQEIESRFANFRPLYEGRPAGENDLRQVLVRENDSARRRAAWEASKEIGREAAPLLLELVAARNAAARSLGFPDFYRMRLVLDQLDEAGLFTVLDDLRRRTDAPFAAAEALRGHLRLGALIFIRWGLVMVYFERAMYRDPKQDLSRLWWELVRELQLVTPPEGRDAPDYASKIHLGTAPVYYHNYLLGLLAASQIRAALTAIGSSEGLVGDRAAGDFLRERLFSVGARFHWNEMLRRATGEGLSAEHFAAEFIGDGSSPRA